MNPRVLITDWVHPLLKERLTEIGFDVEENPVIEPAELLNSIDKYFGLIVSTRTSLNKDLLANAANLKFIGRIGSGMEHIDTLYCAENGITCFSSPEGNANAVGEHCLGLLLSVMNNISLAQRQMIEGKWIREGNRGDELDGKTVGIIGFGHTGPAFAKKLKGFDVRILVFDKYKDVKADVQVEPSSLQKIQDKADVISFHVPHTSETHHYLNKTFMEKCNKKVIYLNTSRGPVASTADILWGIKNGKIAGVGIDVFEDEPLHKGEVNKWETYYDLITYPEVVCTPHIAGWSKQSKVLLASVLADKISNWWLNERQKIGVKR